MSHSTYRRGAALLMSAGLAALTLAAAPAQAADITAQNTFSLSKAGGGKIALGGAGFETTHSGSWSRSSKDFGSGVTCSGFKCSGSSEVLNTAGSWGVDVTGSAAVGSATMDFTQGTTTKLSGGGNQYAFTTMQAYVKNPTFTTSVPDVKVTVKASLNYQDTLTAKGCAGACTLKQVDLLQANANDFQVFAENNGSLSLGDEHLPFPPPITIVEYKGTFHYGAPPGLNSGVGTQTQAQASTTNEVASANANLLAKIPVIQGSIQPFKLEGVKIGAVGFKAGSFVLNIADQLIQSATMTVTHAVKTFFQDSKSQAIAVPVHLAGAPAGAYSSLSEVDGEAGFTLGDGVTSLAGDQIVTATTYDVAFHEFLSVRLTGDVNIKMFSGDVEGSPFGPLYSGDPSLNLPDIVLYDHIYHEYFTTYDILTIPGLSGGVPEPATWALMLLGFGGMGLMLRRRPRIARAA